MSDQKAQERAQLRRELSAYLARRIPELHAQGYKGRNARDIAQAEFYRGR